jgi:cobalt-zinc-cadmium efflux system membrane fusion protein
MKHDLVCLVGRWVLVLACCVSSWGCKKSEAATEPNMVVPPAGEVWLTAEQVKNAAIGVEAAAVRDVDDAILTSGRVAFDDQRVGHVFSPVTGRVVQIQAQLGAHVKKGQALATIESPDIGSAVSDESKAEADLVAAEHDYRRQRDLMAERATSQAVLEQSEDNWRKAKAELERARQKTSLLRAGGVDVVTQTYRLVSPIDGEVLARNINPGIEVQGQYASGTAQELFTVGELDTVWVISDLYEIDLARVHVGSPVDVNVVSYKDQSFAGTVDWVSGMLDPTTRTAKVRCTLANADRKLRPEMYATARVSVDRKKVLAIPRSALLRLGEYKVVFVEVGRDESRVRFGRVPVDVDESEASPWLEVKHGIEAGQPVVVSGAVLLSQRL